MRRSTRWLRRITLAAGVLTLGAWPAAASSVVAPNGAGWDVAVTLRGSLAAMKRQHGVALDLGYTFARTTGEVARLERNGELVRMSGNEDYTFRSGVMSAVARPEMRLFIERLAAEYRAACGEQLVVTSLTRPLNRQPGNAHRLSVHPAGIAVDLRISRSVECRSWIEDRLLEMEMSDVLDVTRERYPPHYHVALFPDGYMTWVQPQLQAEALEARRIAGEAAAAEAALVAREEARKAAIEAAARQEEERRRAGLLLAVLVPAGVGVAATVHRRGRRPLLLRR